MTRFIILLVSLVTFIFPSTSMADDGWFVQVPVASEHWGETGGYEFNEENWGIGLGYSWDQPNGWKTSASVAVYSDSYACRAVGARLRHVKQISHNIHVGGALHVTDKCIDPYNGNQTFVAPTASVLLDVSEQMAISIDFVPEIEEINPVGFAAFAVEWSFGQTGEVATPKVQKSDVLYSF